MKQNNKLIKRIFVISIPVLLIGYLTGSIMQSVQRPIHKDISNNNFPNRSQKSKASETSSEHVKTLKCKLCHESEFPTKEAPGLQKCPREEIAADYHAPKEGPDVVVIDKMSDNYGEVIFPHKVHAEMSEMSESCIGCHHYNTTGPVLNCNKCHDISRSREDVSVPDLKAAYHRQCMSCHKQWSGENGCSKNCHLKKDADRQLAIENLKGKSHPEILQPEKITWETKSKINKIVTFYHDEHINLFRIECRSCHNQESCIKCHSQKSYISYSAPVKIEKSLEEHHQACNKCHYGNSCTKCHNEKEISPFNHGKSTGWQLSIYHSNLACSKCHGSSMPYRKLAKSCISCHSNFADKFDHKLKGFVFSEAHCELECENCHAKKDFTKNPVCSDCHDDKSYPKDLPGIKNGR